MASLNLEEKANFTRLSRLLVDKGTEALRNTLDSRHPPANLPTVLNANRAALQKLKPRVINNAQWNLLFPSSGNLNSKTFDVTLIAILLRNICGLSAPATGWNAMPPDMDRSTEANVTRIRLFRNQVYAHVHSTQVDNATFKNLWGNISQALVELKIPQQEIDDLKTSPLGPEEEIYAQQLEEAVLKEGDSKKILVNVQQQFNQSNIQQQENSEIISNSLQHLTQISEESRQMIKQVYHSGSKQIIENKRPVSDSDESEFCVKRIKAEEEPILQKLAKHNFNSKIKNKVKSFHPCTRDWLLKKLETWFTTKDESRLFILTAGPGFGKSVFAAKVCELFTRSSKLAACHFCDFSDSNLKDPMTMLQSLASQMCETVPGFKEKLIDQLKRPNKIQSLKDAFQIYLQNPLDELKLVEPRLIVIDGLDESASDDKNEMVKLISDHFPDLPEYVKVLVTSRPGISMKTLRHFQKIKINANHEENESDLLRYLKVCLPRLQARDEINPSERADRANYSSFEILPAIVINCEGSFLYAFHVQLELRRREDLHTVTYKEIMSFLPKGMGSVYEAYFCRFEEELEAVMNKKPDLFKLLELLVASRGPLPLRFVAMVFGLDPDIRETKRIINEVNEAVSCLLYVSDDFVTVFHKSVCDWLLSNGYDDHEYTVKVSDGEKQMWLCCGKVFEEIKRNVTLGHKLKLTSDVKHSLDYGHDYLVGCNMTAGFPWLVDMIILHVFFTIYPRTIFPLGLLANVLRNDDTISFNLRKRISWHYIEIDYLEKVKHSLLLVFEYERPFSYLEAVLYHSPEECFSNSEKETAELHLAKIPRWVKRKSVETNSMKPLVVKFCSRHITAIGVSSNRKLAAIALAGGTICVLSLPELVKLWQVSTKHQCISCCIFAPDDSMVLYGQLEIVLNVVEKKEELFFMGNKEKFSCCAFSSNGNMLVTSNRSTSIKLWDVVKQSLVYVLRAGVRIDFCSFSKTGIYIIGNQEALEDVYCVWCAITFQRADQRSLSFSRHTKKDRVPKSEKCNRCFRQDRKELIPFKASKRLRLFNDIGDKLSITSTGIYKREDCIFYLDRESLRVYERIHFTTIAELDIFPFNHLLTFIGENEPKGDIKAIEDDLWLRSDGEILVIYSSVLPKNNQLCLSRPTRVLWCSFSPCGTRLATCASDGFINLWNVDTCKVYQRSRSVDGSDEVTLSAACWWSDKYLFVFYLINNLPFFWKYEVDEHLEIIFTRRQQVPLCFAVKSLLPFKEIRDFTEGFLTLIRVKPTSAIVLRVLNVHTVGQLADLVVLPGVIYWESISVSSGGSFILSASVAGYTLWRRSEANLAVYEVLVSIDTLDFMYAGYFSCCFSNDSKFAVVPHMTADTISVLFIDVNTTMSRTITTPSDYRSHDLIPKAFCFNKVVILVSPVLIYLFNLESWDLLGCSFERYLTDDVVSVSKVSPKGNVLAAPRLSGDMDFFQLSIP